MNKNTKLGIMKSLSRTELKKVLGGVQDEDAISDGGKCSDSNCRMQDNGVRKECPTGCKCESSELRPCY